MRTRRPWQLGRAWSLWRARVVGEADVDGAAASSKRGELVCDGQIKLESLELSYEGDG